MREELKRVLRMPVRRSGGGAGGIDEVCALKPEDLSRRPLTFGLRSEGGNPRGRRLFLLARCRGTIVDAMQAHNRGLTTEKERVSLIDAALKNLRVGLGVRGVLVA
jgi:hypothetical protein